MRRINEWNHEQIIDYNLRGGGNEFSIFEDTQTDRVRLTQAVIDILLLRLDGPAVINEPGCSTGDISGPYAAEGHDVWACDVTPGAYQEAQKRYPRLKIDNVTAESVEPKHGDILVMCEFLEHIIDPVGFAGKWMPKSKYAIISHPVMEDGKDPEIGHLWAYYPQDYVNWFAWNNYHIMGTTRWNMGFYPMVLIWGEKK